MKACVLYSGGKDSSLMAITLKRLGFDVEVCTANFGVYDSFVPASMSAKALGIPHRVLHLDKKILEDGVKRIMDDGFPNEGIKYIHNQVIEAVAEEYPVVADGTRRDDKTPKLNRDQIQSLEDRKDVQYINLDSFGYKTVNTLVSSLFKVTNKKSNRDNSSDYEVEIRFLIDQLGGDSSSIFPEHNQTNVVGLKD